MRGGGEPISDRACGLPVFSRGIMPIVGVFLEGLRYTAERAAEGFADAGGLAAEANCGAGISRTGVEDAGVACWAGDDGDDVLPDLLDLLEPIDITRLREFERELVSRRRSKRGLSDFDSPASSAMVVVEKWKQWMGLPLTDNDWFPVFIVYLREAAWWLVS